MCNLGIGLKFSDTTLLKIRPPASIRASLPEWEDFGELIRASLPTFGSPDFHVNKGLPLTDLKGGGIISNRVVLFFYSVLLVSSRFCV